MSHFISAILNMARKVRFIAGLFLLVAFSFVSLANAYELKPLSGHSHIQPFTLIFPVLMGYGIVLLRTLCRYGVLIPFLHITSSVRYMRTLAMQLKKGGMVVAFGATNCGDAWGDTTLAICHTWYRGSEIFQTDIVFNSNKSWNVYSTPWKAAPWSGVGDFQRVAVHELGHALGLGHEDGGVAAIMRSYVGDVTIPQQDDINGVAALYGAACANPPVKVAGNYYDTVQAAYNSAASGNTVQIQEKTFIENVLLNRNITTILEGGYNCQYDTNTGYSTVNGSVTISNGTITVNKLIIK
jgi:hypothetical protein